MPYIGNQPAQLGAYAVESFNGGGSSFTLSKSATTETVLLFIDGVRQTPTDAYSVSGTTLTTTATTPSGTNNVTVQFLGDVVDFGEPSDNSVTSTKIVDGTIVNADINASAAIALSKLSTTGTADNTTFLRGDGAWAAAGGGKLVQFKNANTQSSFSTAVALNYESSSPIPNTAGIELITLSITPTSASNRLWIHGTSQGVANAAATINLALYQDSGNAISVSSNAAGNNQGSALDIWYEMAAGTTSSTTFKMRGGPQSTGYTAYFNQRSGGAAYGGVPFISLTIMEIEP